MTDKEIRRACYCLYSQACKRTGRQPLTPKQFAAKMVEETKAATDETGTIEVGDLLVAITRAVEDTSKVGA